MPSVLVRSITALGDIAFATTVLGNRDHFRYHGADIGEFIPDELQAANAFHFIDSPRKVTGTSAGIAGNFNIVQARLYLAEPDLKAPLPGVG